MGPLTLPTHGLVYLDANGVTNDTVLRRVEGLPVVVLDDFFAEEDQA